MSLIAWLDWARLYWGSRRTREAVVLNRRDLIILEHPLGLESTELANPFWDYGGILKLRGDYVTGASFMAKVSKVFERGPSPKPNFQRAE